MRSGPLKRYELCLKHRTEGPNWLFDIHEVPGPIGWWVLFKGGVVSCPMKKVGGLTLP